MSSNDVNLMLSERHNLLVDSDWTQLPDSPLTDTDKQAWAIYRQQLRDLPANPNWPNVEFPDPPT